MLSNYELWRQVLCKGMPGTQQYNLVVSLPDDLVAVHLPSALPEFCNPSFEGVRCLLCGHSSDDMGPLGQYRSQTCVTVTVTVTVTAVSRTHTRSRTYGHRRVWCRHKHPRTTHIVTRVTCCFTPARATLGTRLC